MAPPTSFHKALWSIRETEAGQEIEQYMQSVLEGFPEDMNDDRACQRCNGRRQIAASILNLMRKDPHATAATAERNSGNSG